ncbi:L-serine ammonia-lyase [Cupriavidus sp. AcVe19-6a]|uniref:L-serine ammonia-lyase n=1 Tax=Cupriavidus sp. AcVe19-6a TaxID=2821358 RepID=UPI001AE318A7|nr:L-serine ammonia-lyase [Cupriavidus sp. AcVe19-6a]MBP0639402.1 L-serine ammonia-lyase [Cupriavidus sp. AcVe19-6a]
MFSVFDIFRVGIGPSSSHTVGPMRAATSFVTYLTRHDILKSVGRVSVGLYGSFAATGKGHGTPTGVMLGLMGYPPDTIQADAIGSLLEQAQESEEISLGKTHTIPFQLQKDVQFYRRSLEEHPNGMEFQAWSTSGELLLAKRYFSVGGGAIASVASEETSAGDAPGIPYPFRTAAELLDMCEAEGLSIDQLMMVNETSHAPMDVVQSRVLALWHVMQATVHRGLHATGKLPGPLGVRRRAATLYQQLNAESRSEQVNQLDWLSAFAMAVNEENAAGGQMVTAPTNGAAGVIPAVLHYYDKFVPGANQDGIIRFMLTAAAIASLYKLNASLSGAQVGCQGEVGVACSMAAAGLCAVLGGTPSQVANAAEIGMEHNLGLTCDPVGGLVQIPCIERNAMASGKALHAARLALRGDGSHFVSLDAVIKTMWETGLDMKTKYKETSRGGLAVNIVEC